MPTRHAPCLLLAALCLAVPFGAAGQESDRAAPDMARIPAGAYRPLYSAGAVQVRVDAFRLDVDPVTRGEFAEFLRSNTRWSRDAARSMAGAANAGTLADETLADRGAAADAKLDRQRPVTAVSWYAARAYCAAQGKRLPTLNEWEYAAAASATRRDATDDPAFMQQLVTLYASRPRPLPPIEHGGRNVYGVRGMHDLGWEWVDDVGRRPAGSHAHHEPHASHDAYCASAAVGASDPRNYAAFLRFAVRSGLTPESTLETLGFRCAR